jgi:hypothetical protein
VLGAFLLGTWFNRRRGKALGAWLNDGLRGLGGQPTWTFVRSVSSGAQGALRNPNAPFRSFEAGYFLLTREVPPLLLIEWLRGKRDLLSVKADLRSGPKSEFDLVPLDGALRRELDAAAGDQPLSWVALPSGLGVATRAANPDQVAARVRPFVEKYGKSVQRLSVRQRQPNLILFMSLTGAEDRPAADIFNALRRVV